MELKEHNRVHYGGLYQHFYTNKEGKLEGKYVSYCGSEVFSEHYYINGIQYTREEWLMNKIRRIIK